MIPHEVPRGKLLIAVAGVYESLGVGDLDLWKPNIRWTRDNPIKLRCERIQSGADTRGAQGNREWRRSYERWFWNVYFIGLILRKEGIFRLIRVAARRCLSQDLGWYSMSEMDLMHEGWGDHRSWGIVWMLYLAWSFSSMETRTDKIGWNWKHSNNEAIVHRHEVCRWDFLPKGAGCLDERDPSDSAITIVARRSEEGIADSASRRFGKRGGFRTSRRSRGRTAIPAVKGKAMGRPQSYPNKSGPFLQGRAGDVPATVAALTNKGTGPLQIRFAISNAVCACSSALDSPCHLEKKSNVRCSWAEWDISGASLGRIRAYH